MKKQEIIELEQTLMSERKNMNLTVEQLTAHLKRLKLDNVASVLENGPDHSVDVSKDDDEKDKIEEEKIGYITNNNSRVTKSELGGNIFSNTPTGWRPRFGHFSRFFYLELLILHATGDMVYLFL